MNIRLKISISKEMAFESSFANRLYQREGFRTENSFSLPLISFTPKQKQSRVLLSAVYSDNGINSHQDIKSKPLPLIRRWLAYIHVYNFFFNQEKFLFLNSTFYTYIFRLLITIGKKQVNTAARCAGGGFWCPSVSQ